MDPLASTGGRWSDRHGRRGRTTETAQLSAHDLCMHVDGQLIPVHASDALHLLSPSSAGLAHLVPHLEYCHQWMPASSSRVTCCACRHKSCHWDRDPVARHQVRQWTRVVTTAASCLSRVRVTACKASWPRSPVEMQRREMRVILAFDERASFLLASA